jgi:hypothetical protein
MWKGLELDPFYGRLVVANQWRRMGPLKKITGHERALLAAAVCYLECVFFGR